MEGLRDTCVIATKIILFKEARFRSLLFSEVKTSKTIQLPFGTVVKCRRRRILKTVQPVDNLVSYDVIVGVNILNLKFERSPRKAQK
jgi:hypothetical protein